MNIEETHIPELWEDICESWKEELKESFKPYFEEQCLEQYLRGLHEWDDVAVTEILEESGEFIEEYLQDKINLMDEC